MFELLLETDNVLTNGALTINEASDWTASDKGARNQYGVFLKGDFRISADASNIPLTPDPLTPLTDITWEATMGVDGRYTFTAYAYLTEANVPAPNEGDLSVSAAGALQQRQSAAWVVVPFEEHLADAVYTGVLEIAYLPESYIYKNQLNLEYIQQVKGDIAKGAEQNKLYYKRTDLDYFSSLIDAAGYNHALALWSNYYEIIANLTDIRLNQQIS